MIRPELGPASSRPPSSTTSLPPARWWPRRRVHDPGPHQRPLEVFAEPPPDVDEEAFGFTREKKTVDLRGGFTTAGFDEAVVGMSKGDSKNVTIPVEKAYGPRNEELVLTAPISQVPADINPEVGQKLEMGGPNGELVVVNVVAVTDEISSGTIEATVRSSINISSVKTIPAIGALKIPETAPAAPHPTRSVIFL